MIKLRLKSLQKIFLNKLSKNFKYFILKIKKKKKTNVNFHVSKAFYQLKKNIFFVNIEEKLKKNVTNNSTEFIFQGIIRNQVFDKFNL